MQQQEQMTEFHAERQQRTIPEHLRKFLHADATKCRHVYDCGDIYSTGSCGHKDIPLCMGCGVCNTCGSSMKQLHAERQQRTIPSILRKMLSAETKKCRHVYDCGDIYSTGSCGHKDIPLCMGCGVCNRCG